MTGFTIRFSLRFGILSAQNFVDDSQMGKVNGLVGKFDNDKTNDLTDRDGNLICIVEPTDGSTSNCTNQIIHEQFGESCK